MGDFSFEKGINHAITSKKEVKIEEYTKGKTIVSCSQNNPQNLSGFHPEKNGFYYDPVCKKYKTRTFSEEKSIKNLSYSLNHKLRPLLENNF